MKHYKMTKEEKDHFVLHDKRDGKSFRVAKSGLSGAHQDKVRKMADGGLVEDDDANSQGFAPPPSDLGNFFATATAPAPNAQNIPIDPSASVNFASTQDLDQLAAKLPKGPSAGEGAVLPPAVNPNTAASGDAGGMQQASYSTPASDAATALGRITADNDKIIGDQVKALQASTATAASAAAQQAKIAENYQAQVQQLQLKQQEQYGALDKEQEAIKQDIAAAKIDPHRIWSNASTGNKVLAGIGVLLSGIGSGLAGGPNLAMTVLQKTIDQDIDAQKAELGKKENLLAQNLRRYGDVNTATAATAMQLNSVMQAQIGAQVAKIGSAQVRQQGDAAIAQLQMQNNAYKQQLSTQAVKNQILDQGGAQGLTPGIAEQVAPGRWLNTPAGIKFAKTPEEAKKLNDAAEIAQTIDQKLNNALAFLNKEGTTLPGEDANVAAESMSTDLGLTLKEFYKLGVLSGPDADLIAKVNPNIGGIRTDKARAQIMELKRAVKDGMTAAYAQRLVNPSGLGPAPTAGQDKGTGMQLSNWRK